jgi:pyridoxamine 5'-phosphate oxidase
MEKPPVPVHPLRESEVAADPLEQFARWFDDARASGIDLPEAMTLSTVSPSGFPSSRMVLLKGVDARGFQFFTNYRSRKALEIDANPAVALTFHWRTLERQVRVEGAAERLGAEESDAYFATRPRGSQIGAWASDQSEIAASRKAIDARYTELEARFEGGPVPRPPHWGGYVVKPLVIELWQGRKSRLHDRLRYTRNPAGWSLVRLWP